MTGRRRSLVIGLMAVATLAVGAAGGWFAQASFRSDEDATADDELATDQAQVSTTAPTTTTTVEPTTTTSPPTTTAPTSTTTTPILVVTLPPTTTTAPTPQFDTADAEARFVVEQDRDNFVGGLAQMDDVDTVDKLTYEPAEGAAFVIGESGQAPEVVTSRISVGVTSVWQGDEKQHETAWVIARYMAALWAPEQPMHVTGAAVPLDSVGVEIFVDENRYVANALVMSDVALQRLSFTEWLSQAFVGEM